MRMDRARLEQQQLKQSRQAALQDQGRKSLDRKPKKGSPQDDAVFDDSASSTASPSNTGKDTPPSREGRVRRVAHHTGYLPSNEYQPALPKSPMKELEDEGDDGDDENERGSDPYSGVVTPADLDSVPWHHAQLYKLYGRNAEQFIRPKVQPEPKKVINPTLKSQKVKKLGHMGAAHLWTTLRTDSVSKLLRTDQRFPQELKNAFSAHVREGITKHKKPVYRNFTAVEDVPGLPRLMDQSILKRVRSLRHKTEIMYRSSKTNHDRTKVLLFSNPMPYIDEGEESIGQYLPSWHDMPEDEAEEEYMRWIRDQVREAKRLRAEAEDKKEGQEEEGGEEGRAKTQHPESVLSPLGSDTSDSLQNIWHSIMARQRPRRQPRYEFLKERDAVCEGLFHEKYKKDQQDNLPPVRQSLPAFKSHSAMDITRHSIAATPERSESAHELASRHMTSWQPLSMSALVEYKEQLKSEGVGEFQHGRPRMWPVEANP